VTVRNGTVSGFSRQVQLGRSPGSVSRARISRLRFVNGEFGLDGYADRSRFAFNTSAAARAADGLFGGELQITGTGNTVTHNVALGNLLSPGGAQDRVDHNHVNLLDHAPTGAGGSVLANNVAQQILIFGGDFNATSPTVTVIHNRLVQRTGDIGFAEGGIILLGASHAIVANNEIVVPSTAGQTAFDRPPSGIEVEGLNANLLVNNLVSGAGIQGIFIRPGSTNTVLSHNIVVNNGFAEVGQPGDGILNDAPTTTLTANIANSNANLGIDSVAGAIDGGGNHAHGNGNPLQCTNIVCSP
jgi:parallel beta-helix repeat protein